MSRTSSMAGGGPRNITDCSPLRNNRALTGSKCRNGARHFEPDSIVLDGLSRRGSDAVAHGAPASGTPAACRPGRKRGCCVACAARGADPSRSDRRAAAGTVWMRHRRRLHSARALRVPGRCSLHAWGRSAVHSARCRTRAAAHAPTLLRCLTRRSPVQALKSQRASTQAAPVDAAGTRLPSQVAPPLPPPRLRAPCDVHRALRAPACTQPPSLTECRCYRSRARRPSFVPHRLLPLSLSPRRPQEMSCSDPGAVAHGPCLHRRSVDHPVHLRQNLRGPRQTARSSMNGRSAQTTRLLPCWQLSGSSVGRTRRL